VQHEFAPPPPRGLGRALVLALLAHGVLALILTAGTQWKRSAPTPVTFEAELWAAVPTQAAPAAPIEVPEEPTASTPPLPPVPAQPVAPPPPVVKAPAPDITLAREKERQKKEEQQRLELEKQKQEKAKQEKLKQEKAAKDKAEKDRLEKEKLAKEKDRQKDDKQTKLDATKKEKEEQRKLEEMRQQNLKRMAGMAASGGGTGDAKSTGTAAQSGAPSAGYAGRVRGKVKPNIVFPDILPTNPATEVEVRTSPDGTIISTRIVQSSGVKSWDEAVLKALEKTEVLPKDTDGRVPSPMIISFRPRDN
jgi:colicin import membrane protein